MSVIQRFCRSLALVVLAGATSACTATGGGYFTPALSADAANLSPAAAVAVADDMVAKLAEHVGPGTGTIVVKPDGSAFGRSLEESLRGWGYAVASNQDATGDNMIPLAYAVGLFEGTVMTRISTPSIELTRTYSMSATGATPTSPLSVMQRASQGEGT